MERHPAIEFNKSGFVWLESFEFTDGTIEFDAPGEPEQPKQARRRILVCPMRQARPDSR